MFLRPRCGSQRACLQQIRVRVGRHFCHPYDLPGSPHTTSAIMMCYTPFTRSSKRRAISTCILNTFAGCLLDRVNRVLVNAFLMHVNYFSGFGF